MSSKKVVPTIEKVEEVVGPVADEKVTVELSFVPVEANPIDAKIALLTVGQQTEIAQFKALLPMFASKKVLADPFKVFVQSTGLYETSTNQEEVNKLQASIDSAKGALKSAGFAEDSAIVMGAIKGLVSELTKASAKVSDNLPQLATYFGVELAKTGKNAPAEANGIFKMAKVDLAMLKSQDWLYSEGDAKGIVIHSMSISESDLLTFKITPASDTWVVFSYNGELTFDRVKTEELTMVSTIKTIPENWMSVKPLTGMTLESLSGFTGKVARLFGRTYHNNGWSGMSMLAQSFDKVQRVVKQA
jgi:hypothetical protein